VAISSVLQVYQEALFRGHRAHVTSGPHVYAGNFLHNLENWCKITSDPWVLNTVFKISFKFISFLVQSVLPTPPPFSEGENELVDEQITNSLAKAN